MEEVRVALERLKTAIGQGRVRVFIAPNGAVTFTGWSGEARAGMNDACAFRTLSAQGSWELRKAVAAAEAKQGRKVNRQMVTAGVHSHDGGKTWGRD